MVKRNKVSVSSVIGISLIIINSIWIIFHMNLFIEYHLTSILHITEIPDWALGINTILGIVGEWIGVKVLKKKITAPIGVIIEIALIFIGIILIKQAIA